MTEQGKHDETLLEAFGLPLAIAGAAAVACVIAYVARDVLQGKLDNCNSIPGRLGSAFDEGAATNCGVVPLLFDTARGFLYLSLLALVIMLVLISLLAYFHFSGRETIGGGAWPRAAAEETGPSRTRVRLIPPGAVPIDDLMTE